MGRVRGHGNRIWPDRSRHRNCHYRGGERCRNSPHYNVYQYQHLAKISSFSFTGQSQSRLSSPAGSDPAGLLFVGARNVGCRSRPFVYHMRRHSSGGMRIRPVLVKALTDLNPAAAIYCAAIWGSSSTGATADIAFR
jgi:hypothetical protein